MRIVGKRCRRGTRSCSSRHGAAPRRSPLRTRAQQEREAAMGQKIRGRERVAGRQEKPASDSYGVGIREGAPKASGVV